MFEDITSTGKFCVRCHYSCATCVDAEACSSCDAATMRVETPDVCEKAIEIRSLNE